MEHDISSVDLQSRIDADFLDDLDEELELELDDLRGAGIEPAHRKHAALDRTLYFRELLRLQGELVKLQD